jgi:hypothetical protein
MVDSIHEHLIFLRNMRKKVYYFINGTTTDVVDFIDCYSSHIAKYMLFQIDVLSEDSDALEYHKY